MSGRIKRKVDDYIAPEFGQALSCSMYRAYLFTLSGRPYLIVRTLYSAADHTLHHADVFLSVAAADELDTATAQSEKNALIRHEALHTYLPCPMHRSLRDEIPGRANRMLLCAVCRAARLGAATMPRLG